MKMRRYILIISILALAGASGFAMATPTTASALPNPPITIIAATKVDCKSGEAHPKDWRGEVDDNACCPTEKKGNPTAMECLMAKYINPVVNLLALAIGIVVVGSIIVAGIQYSSSQGDPGKVSAAKKRILNSLVALGGFIFLYAFFQWVAPGGWL